MLPSLLVAAGKLEALVQEPVSQAIQIFYSTMRSTLPEASTASHPTFQQHPASGPIA
jgi:hypothetical protein